jgi:4-hydroxy-tetrahydrodipicolinate synthase
MSDADLSGVICATLTPFSGPVGPVDETWISAHLRFLEANGIHGVLPLGTTGEGPSLSLMERQRVIDLVLDHRGSLAVIASTGCVALPDTIELSRYALARGADAVLVMPPFYFKDVPESGVLAYYQALCDALPNDARLLLYHYPAITAVPITPGIIEGLILSHPQQLYGMKDSSGDVRYLADVLYHYPRLNIFVGNELQADSGLTDGAIGMISGLANVWPGLATAVFDAHCKRGDLAAAQTQLSTLANLVTTMGNVPSVLKAALPWVSELPRTSVRAPLVNLSQAEAAYLKNKLAAAGIVSV